MRSTSTLSRSRAAALPIVAAMILAGSASGQCEPAILGSVDTAGEAYEAFGVAVSGTVAYVADLFLGLQVIDVSDPANPAILGSVDTPGYARGVAVSGTFAYVADENSGLQVIDVSDPTNPAILGSVDTPDLANGVAVSGTVAYGVDRDSGLQVIDVSDPANPAILGSVETPGTAFGVAVSGGVAYVADGSFGGLQVIDVSDPANPATVGSVDTPNSAYDVAVSGTVAYVADWMSGLQIIDVSNPANPAILGSVDTPSAARRVAVSGTVAYVADTSSGLQVIDVSDPANPMILGSVDTPSYAFGVAVSGTVAYVADLDSGLQVIDVSPSMPPTADAGEPRSVHPGDLVFLGGHGSWDDNTATEDLEFAWAFTERPPGSVAFLIGADTIAPTFVPDLLGTYRVQLIVTDCRGLDSDQDDEVELSSENIAPIANAGVDAGGVVGLTSDLDGFGSSDPDDDPIWFSWSFHQKPEGSVAALADADTEFPSFVPDLPGIYMVELVVNDPYMDSEPDLVTITVVTGEDFVENTVVEMMDNVADLPPADVTTSGNAQALINFMSQAIELMQEGDIDGALDKIRKALERTDGCVERGEPDGNGPGRDWITDCDDQADVYEALKLAEDALLALP